MNAAGKKSNAVAAVLVTWLIVGTLDISSAIVLWLWHGVTLMHGFQAIASGLLGRNAYAGGLATAALGLAVHYFIALIVVVLFYLASRKIIALTTRPFLFGTLYGIAVFLVMYGVVLPQRFPKFRHSLGNDGIEFIIHIVLIGLPTAYLLRRHSLGKGEV